MKVALLIGQPSLFLSQNLLYTREQLINWGILLGLNLGFEIKILYTASKSDIINAINSLKPTDEIDLAILFTGHGFLSISSEQCLATSNWYITLEEIIKLTSKFKSLLFILDCCRSFPNIFKALGTGTANPVATLTNICEVRFLAFSCAFGQVTIEYEHLGSSEFLFSILQNYYAKKSSGLLSAIENGNNYSKFSDNKFDEKMVACYQENDIEIPEKMNNLNKSHLESFINEHKFGCQNDTSHAYLCIDCLSIVCGICFTKNHYSKDYLYKGFRKVVCQTNKTCEEIKNPIIYVTPDIDSGQSPEEVRFMMNTATKLFEDVTD